MQALQMLLADGIVDEILGQLKSGKEADVWLVRHNGETVAAKIYKEREFRSFKNNAEYKEGRQVRNSRTQRAMNSGSRFGQKASEEAWKAAEADTLAKLHAAGARVPKPVLFYEGVLLMEVVIDAEGRVAPRLVDAAIAPGDARGFYDVVRAQAVKMLCADMIHGDLSEFNVLLAHDGPMVIDFPQVVSAAANSRSEHFFKRDLENVRRFFATLDPTLNSRVGDADEIWRAYVRRDLAPDFVPSGRPPPPPAQNRQNNRPPDRRPPPQNQQRGGPAVSFRGVDDRNVPSQPASTNDPRGRGGEPRNAGFRGQPGGGGPGNRNGGFRGNGGRGGGGNGNGGARGGPNGGGRDFGGSEQGRGGTAQGDSALRGRDDSTARGGDTGQNGAPGGNHNAGGRGSAGQPNVSSGSQNGGSHGNQRADAPRGNQQGGPLGAGNGQRADAPRGNQQGGGQNNGRPNNGGQNNANRPGGGQNNGQRLGGNQNPPGQPRGGNGQNPRGPGNQSASSPASGEYRGNSGSRGDGGFGGGRPSGPVNDRQPGGGHRRRRRRYF